MKNEDKLDLILEILRQHDKRFDQIDKRFDQAERKAERFEEEVKENFRDIKYDLRLDKEKLEKVYESRDKVTIQFGWQWAAASFFIAFVSSSMVLSFAG